MPRVSVILPVRNGKPYLPQAVESILGQTFPDFELIVIDDASADSTPEYLAGLADPRVRVIRNKENLGISRTLNTALGLARGEYIARQDADDVSLPYRLDLQVEFLGMHPEVDLVGSPAIIINEAEEEIGAWGVPCADIDIKWWLLFCSPFIHTSVMFRRAAVERVGAYSVRPGCQYIEDYDLWLRLAATSVLANLQEPLVRWRARADSVSSRNRGQQSEQWASLSVATVQELLTPENLDPTDWSAFKKLVLGSPREPVHLNSSEVTRGIGLGERIQNAFYRRYQLAPHSTRSHHRCCSWLWGKHMLALAYRNNGSRDLRCRLTLLSAGIRLLGNAGRLTVS